MKPNQLTPSMLTEAHSQMSSFIRPGRYNTVNPYKEIASTHQISTEAVKKLFRNQILKIQPNHVKMYYQALSIISRLNQDVNIC
jgi:hypothetical protein